MRRADVASVLGALAARPFLIVAGLSGTGKTQLVRRLAVAISERGLAWTRQALRDCEAQGCGGLLESEGHLFSGVPGKPEYVTVAALSAIVRNHDTTLDQRRVAFQPVRPDWNDSKRIWGNYNPLSGRFHPTDALIVLLNAFRSYLWQPVDPDLYFLILDEMNLARVEYYLSDLLSLMEAGCQVDPEDPALVHLGEMARVHPLETCITSLGFRGVAQVPPPGPSNNGLDEGGGGAARPEPNRAPPTSEAQLVPLWELEEERWLYEPLVKASPTVRRPPEALNRRPEPQRPGYRRRSTLEQLFPIPPRIGFPPNLVIIGTVNVDETTHGFSPKVLDRSFVADLTHVDHDAVFGDDPGYARLRPLVQGLHAILEPWELQVGYRSVAEMLDYVEASAERPQQQLEDELLRSKILPRMAGSEERVATPLAELLALCLWGPGHTRPVPSLATLAATRRPEALLAAGDPPPLYPEAARKLLAMARRLVETGFATFF